MLQMAFYSAIIVSFILHPVGLLVNLFIVVVHCRTWVKSHQLSSSDRILFSVGITRFLMLGLCLLEATLFLISLNDEQPAYLRTFFLLSWIFLDSSSLWFITLLNIFYCVKITNLQHPIFLLLRQNLSAKMPRLLLACVLISAFTTLLHAVLRHTLRFPEFVTWRNGTGLNIEEGLSSLVFSMFSSLFLQFVMNVASASLLIHSLRRHMWKMQRNASGLWRPQTDAYMGAMKLMACFLLIYIPCSAAVLFCYLSSSVRMGLGTKAVCMIISICYPSVHSVVIVLTHPKLKSQAKQILCFNK
ncbi:taste receptor type 2 member 4 [Saccopteryx leptura]|uniref:taste receptor type 2 member 4 n=1 Tax=Saccopteryx leptura TaxID=249018 RepID=UPI00339C82EC